MSVAILFILYIINKSLLLGYGTKVGTLLQTENYFASFNTNQDGFRSSIFFLQSSFLGCHQPFCKCTFPKKQSLNIKLIL